MVLKSIVCFGNDEKWLFVKGRGLGCSHQIRRPKITKALPEIKIHAPPCDILRTRSFIITLVPYAPKNVVFNRFVSL